MRVVLEFHFELDALRDAARDLDLAHGSLAHRHGSVFRQLGRRIESVVDGVASGRLRIAIKELEPGRECIVPPAEMTDLMRDLRAHGVLS